jgi:hypothetical protein
VDPPRPQASPLLRYRSSDLATVWTDPCPCGRSTPRIRIGGRRDDMLRVQAVNVYPQAIGELLHGARHAIVADGDPIVPPLHVYVEGDPDPQKLKAALRTDDRRPRARPGHAPGRRAQDREGVQDRARRPATRSHPEGS